LKNRKLWVALAICLLLFVGAFALAYVWWLADPTVVPPSAQAVEVQRRPLNGAVLAAGAVAVPDPLTLSFAQGGRVAQVQAVEGATVRRGEPLAALATAELDLAVEAAEAELAVAQARLAVAQEAPRPAEIEAARLAAAAAEARYREAAAGPLGAEIAAAEAELSSAQLAYNQLVAGPDADTLRVRKAELDKAEVAVRLAQSAYDRIAWREGQGASPEAAALQAATIDYERALAAYNLASAPPTDDLLSRARANIVAAEARLERLRAGGGAAVEAAAADVARANAEIARLEALPDPQAVAVAAAQVAQAEVAVRQARERQAQAALIAPQDGVVLKVRVQVGETASVGAPVVLLSDGQGHWVHAAVHEAHIARVRPGQRASITFDALPGQSVEGQVRRVASLPDPTRALPAYIVEIEIAAADEGLRPGMTATIEIATEAREAALVVPRGALRLQDGGWVAQVLRDGQTTTVPVSVGLSQGREMEVLKGLSEGDRVLLQ
jgi:HlyD family secretion protein